MHFQRVGKPKTLMTPHRQMIIHGIMVVRLLNMLKLISILTCRYDLIDSVYQLMDAFFKMVVICHCLQNFRNCNSNHAQELQKQANFEWRNYARATSCNLMINLSRCSSLAQFIQKEVHSGDWTSFGVYWADPSKESWLSSLMYLVILIIIFC